MADGLRKLEVEAKVIGHRIGPAPHRIGGRQGVEGGVALHRIEHGGVVGEVFGRLGAKAQQLAGPAGVGPLWQAQIEAHGGYSLRSWCIRADFLPAFCHRVQKTGEGGCWPFYPKGGFPL